MNTEGAFRERAIEREQNHINEEEKEGVDRFFTRNTSSTQDVLLKRDLVSSTHDVDVLFVIIFTAICFCYIF